MSTTALPMTTVRQDSRKEIIKYYCTKFGLNFDTECTNRFNKSFDQLSQDQVRKWLEELGNRRGKQLKSKQG